VWCCLARASARPKSADALLSLDFILPARTSCGSSECTEAPWFCFIPVSRYAPSQFTLVPLGAPGPESLRVDSFAHTSPVSSTAGLFLKLALFSNLSGYLETVAVSSPLLAPSISYLRGFLEDDSLQSCPATRLSI
jgi:hypothetical protein